jgi:hypothetical protein
MSADFPPNNRVLIVDDNPAIHEDFPKILRGEDSRSNSNCRPLPRRDSRLRS